MVTLAFTRTELTWLHITLTFTRPEKDVLPSAAFEAALRNLEMLAVVAVAFQFGTVFIPLEVSADLILDSLLYRFRVRIARQVGVDRQRIPATRSEEHTSELQSLRHLVC